MTYDELKQLVGTQKDIADEEYIIPLLEQIELDSVQLDPSEMRLAITKAIIDTVYADLFDPEVRNELFDWSVRNLRNLVALAKLVRRFEVEKPPSWMS